MIATTTEADLTDGWELPRRPLAPPVDLPDHPDPLAISGCWTDSMLEVFKLWRPSAIYVGGFTAPMRAEFALEGRDTVARYGAGNMRSVPVYVGTSKARNTSASDRLDTMPWPEAEVVLLARVWLQSQGHADQVAAKVAKALADLAAEHDEPTYRGQWHEVRRIGVAGVVRLIEAEAAGLRFQCWDEASLAVFCEDVVIAAQLGQRGIGTSLERALGNIVTPGKPTGRAQ